MTVRLFEILFGRSLATEQGEEEQIGSLTGLAVLGLDALASAAYGPEALLTVLVPSGYGALRGLEWLTPVIVLVLLVVFVSYKQTLPAYPNGGGAYTVAKENLGHRASLLAAAALALDYILNVAVAIAAGIGALVSAVPALLPYTLWLCLGVLFVITLINLRGVRSTGIAFLVPAAVFISMLFLVIALGVIRTVLAAGHPYPIVPPPRAVVATQGLSWVLLLHAFANGCTALTGVEAVSNGVPLFREPRVRNAERTLTLIVTVLVVLLLGEAFLCREYSVVATQPGQPGFRSVLSMLFAAVLGHGFSYYVGLAGVIALLVLSANTSFSGFPRLCRILAADSFLPEPFVHRGRRLVFSYGVLLLAFLAGALLIAFGGITNALIPLFAIGALSAFTLSQLGMVLHYRKRQEPNAKRSMLINAVGAGTTFLTLFVVLVAKFKEGAWLTLPIVGSIWLLLSRVHRHYAEISECTKTDLSLSVGPLDRPLVIVPLRRWDAKSLKALRFALALSSEVTAVQVLTQDRVLEELTGRWHELADEPATRLGFPPPRLVVLKSEYRELFGPLLQFVHRLAADNPSRHIAVIIPELIEVRWYHYLLHNQTPAFLKTLLLHRGGPQIVIVNVPWHLDAVAPERELLHKRVHPWWRRALRW